MNTTPSTQPAAMPSPDPAKRRIEVVGAVLVKDGLVLAAQRSQTMSLSGLWEFPGGKIERGESPEQALRRELEEELKCVVEVGEHVETTAHEYDFAVVVLSTYFCTLLSGTPQLVEHSDVAWLRADELTSLPWAPADVPAVARVVQVLSA